MIMNSDITLVALVFGVFGNIASAMVYLAPLPIILRILRNRSTEQYQSITYLVALFSSAVFLYYGCLTPNGLLIVSNHSIRCFIESVYLIIYITFATRFSRIYTILILVLFNFVAYGAIVAYTHIFLNGDQRIAVVGWISAVFSVGVFAAPFAITIQVIRTRSVEFMPIYLSICLTLSAVLWLVYGLLIKDYFIAVPNILGFVFGSIQVIVYVIYK